MPPAESSPSVAAPDWRTWLLIGATGFGGPAGQIALLHRELVERRRCLDEGEFMDATRLCMVLPGPEAHQLATYAGWRLHGLPGALLAGTLFVLPGAMVVTALAWLHAAGSGLPFVEAAFAGTRPAVIALVAMATWRFARKSIRSVGGAVAAVTALAALAAGVSFPVVVAIAAVAGGLMRFAATTDAGATTAARGHTAAAARTALVVSGVATAVWMAAYAAVRMVAAAGGRAADIATLFTETTLLSLGGAYAVVPWALEESMARGWLEPAEQFHALAMGEATPGPLILVVTFIGFMAGWRSTATGAAAAGIEGAAIATFFAFLPSFALVLGLAPLARSIRQGSRLHAAMSAVGIVVFAALVLLACRLAVSAFVVGGMFDPLAVVVAVTCGYALVRRLATAPVVVLGAAAFAVVSQAVVDALS